MKICRKSWKSIISASSIWCHPSNKLQYFIFRCCFGFHFLLSPYRITIYFFDALVFCLLCHSITVDHCILLAMPHIVTQTSEQKPNWINNYHPASLFVACYSIILLNHQQPSCKVVSTPIVYQTSISATIVQPYGKIVKLKTTSLLLAIVHKVHTLHTWDFWEFAVYENIMFVFLQQQLLFTDCLVLLQNTERRKAFTRHKATLRLEHASLHKRRVFYYERNCFQTFDQVGCQHAVQHFHFKYHCAPTEIVFLFVKEHEIETQCTTSASKWTQEKNKINREN